MPSSRKYTVEEADALVPWLEKTFAEIGAQRARLGPAQAELDRLGRHTRANGHGDIDEKLREAERHVGAVRERLRDLFAAVIEKDIEVRDVNMGLVDFPAERDGHDAWLCWRTGEPSVTHWHEKDHGFKDRKPL
jgi:hypothetical protein